MNEGIIGMPEGFWGRKLGMTQVFDGDKVLPVTAIDVAHWFVIGVRTVERDGYNALCIALLKKRYVDQSFDLDWLRFTHRYFDFVREVRVDDPADQELVGKAFNPCEHAKVGDLCDVRGTTRGRGFQGVIKRHNFRGAPGSHGSMQGRRPGSIGSERSEGEVFKGKKLPGQMGAKTKSVQNLRVARIEEAGNMVMLVGAVPGHSGSLVFVHKAKRG